jgi:N-glycosylase/DNA lyase
MNFHTLSILQAKYESKKHEIKKRLDDFRTMTSQPDEKIFAELSFCLCTPQSKAILCDAAVKSLENNKMLFEGNINQIRPFMNSVRFADNKASYIIEARKKFTCKDNKIKLKERLKSFATPSEAREWLVENVKGLGMKEATHFLRNIGLSGNLAILDRHILKNLVCYGAIDELPKTLTKKKYLEIEQAMQKFSEKVKIPIDELDLLFWSEETGKIFK